MDITLIRYGDEALPEIKQHLVDGQPVVLPNPSPLPYMVVAVSPGTVNRLKGRPVEQPVASFIGHFDRVKAHVDLDPEGLEVAETCLVERQMTVLCPVLDDRQVPAFLLPSLDRDHVLLFAAHLAGIQQLCRSFPALYVSSGNMTGLPPETRCRDVRSQFEEGGSLGCRLLVADGDHLRDRHLPHGSTTMVSISRTGKRSVVRRGIQPL